jgi:ATP-binding cassette subfamily F protein 3
MLEKVEKRYGDKVVITGVDLSLRRGDRLAVMGSNGAGKTTLLRIIAGDVYPERGRRLLGTGLTLGRFAQHQLEAMDPDRTVMEESMHGAPGKKPEEVRRALGSMGIGDVHIERRVRSLSGGERSRVALARLLLNPAALLLLDEPTNHLDLPMREALEQGIAAWPGTLLVVSHDRAFLDRVTTGTLAVEGGVVERIAPGWQAFLEWRGRRHQTSDSVLDSDAISAERSRDSKRARAEAIQERSRRLKPLKLELAETENLIHVSEERLRVIDELFADPTVAADGERMRALVKERDQLSASLAQSYTRWEALSLAVEELS